MPSAFLDLYERLKKDSAHMIGYPGTRIADFSALYPFMDFFINNIGDPFAPSTFRINTHELERNVIDWFRSILHAGDQDTWGYITSGGTEGNTYGVYLAREMLPGGIVYYSEDSHYSVAKILRMVNARSIMIRSRPDGEMDCGDLDETLAVHRDAPPIIFANIGTTMRGAVDSLDSIKDILRKRAIKRYYIHADAALSGMVLPFIDNPPPFDFAAGIDSISISGHKMPGIPLPCGVVLAKREHVNRIGRAVEYVGTNDTTVAGSRNGIAPLFLWYLIEQLGESGFRDIVRNCMETADYAVAQFAARGMKAWRHKHSLTVVFPRQEGDALKKWQIATQGGDAHLICMPHVTRRHIDDFLDDYARMPAQPQKEKEAAG